MRMNPDPERDDALLDALLRDENWENASAAFKAEALGTYRRRLRVRRLARWSGSVAALALVMAGMVHWLGRPSAGPRQMTMVRPEAPAAPDKPRQLTDAELVAAFPKGSCFIAEVDGKKELVFFDPEAARSYMAASAVRGN